MYLFVELRSLKILNRDFFSFEKIGKKSTLLSKVHNSFQIFEHCNLPRSLRTQQGNGMRGKIKQMLPFRKWRALL